MSVFFLAVLSIFYIKILRATDESFEVAAVLTTPISLTAVAGIDFGSASVTGSAYTIVISPMDPGAAIFTATGTPMTSITRSVVESSITIQLNPSNKITVDNFVVTGENSFNSSGTITNLRVGATANIITKLSTGVYTGSATFRVVYQ